MRLSPLAVFALVACDLGPSYEQVHDTDTIQAYEDFLKADPDTTYKPVILKRLEELYFEQAQKENTLAGWKTYEDRFPEGGGHGTAAMKAYSALAWQATLADGSLEAVQKFVDDFPSVDRVMRNRSKGRLAVLQYGKLDVSAPRIEKVNLAENKKGPLDGWGVSVDVTNNGDQTLAFVGMTLDWLGPDGNVLPASGQAATTHDYPLTSDHWTMPATEEQQTPMKPGEKRTWQWTEDFSIVPESGTPNARVYATGLRAMGAAADAP